MNHIPGPAVPTRIRDSRLARPAVVLIAAFGWLVSSSDADPNDTNDDRTYRLDYRVTLEPSAGGAWVEMRLRQPGRYLREVDMPTLDGRLSKFRADGELSRSDDRIAWLPPADGGTLRWFARLAHRRGKDAYDAYIGDDWGLFRAEDIIPSADTRVLRDSRADTRFSFDLPDGWSIVTAYFDDDGIFRVNNPKRRFDTPSGWIVAGNLGVRIETIEGVRIIVAGPVGHSIRRMDLLSLLHWTLPDLLRILPEFPERLTIVSAGDPMWRGALSAPQSVYLHADRPLLSGNATSTLTHEAVHVGLGRAGERGADWIIEGLAEYYSLEVLRRSGTISDIRFRNAHRDLAAWARDADNLCDSDSSGSSTALAVTVMAKLDAEIRKVTDGRAGLDDVIHELSGHSGKISIEEFHDTATEVAGETLKSLQDKRLRGCDTDDE